MKTVYKMIICAMLVISLLLPAVAMASDAEEEQFFGLWTASLSPIVQEITGTDDSADVFHTKLINAGASFNAGLSYVKNQGREDNKNHLAWDSMSYMWPYIRAAYPASDLPSWAEVTGGEDIDRDNFYDVAIVGLLSESELNAVNDALVRLYNWINVDPVQDNTTIILIFLLLIMSAIVAVNRDYEFNAVLFMVAISINITVAIWLELIAFAFIVIPLLILAVLLFRRFGGSDE